MLADTRTQYHCAREMTVRRLLDNAGKAERYQCCSMHSGVEVRIAHRIHAAREVGTELLVAGSPAAAASLEGSGMPVQELCEFLGDCLTRFSQRPLRQRST